ncbi:hypothetical protein PVL30_002666 [Lodderomyces elongisporus]|uniref:uncharacterized protein n=1 Tax=Lodderomyces elongisporus TaxID=36914 RepID=UPI0029273504|nr:uncharacterized protein PVL30_002666 [Lodderomyces elongisporus]WLF78918.1 hypothetical protein PVL30_002666 [Lodderomyces elongisporus]
MVSANANTRPLLQPLLNISPSLGPQVLHIFINHLPFEWFLNSNITFTVPLNDPSKILANQISQTLTPKHFTTTFPIVDAGNRADWSELAEFRSARSKITRRKHLWSFLSFMLRWNVPDTVYDKYCQRSYDKALTLTTPVKTYHELLQLLRELDALPYLRPNFDTVIVQLLRTAFSHKPIHKVIKQIHKETTSYWDFCYVFDSSFYELVPPNIKGKPCRRPPVHHFLRNGLPRCYRDLPTTPTPIAATALKPITHIPDTNHQLIVSTSDLETTPDTAPETLKDIIDENKAQKLEITSSPARPDKHRVNINRTAPFPPNRPLSKTAMAAELAITNSTTGLSGLGTMALTTSHRHSPPCVVFKKPDPRGIGGCHIQGIYERSAYTLAN